MVYIVKAKKGKVVRYISTAGSKKVGRLPVAMSRKSTAKRLVMAKKRDWKNEPRAKGWKLKIVKV